MKKILFSTIAILALAVMGCNKSELVPEHENAFTIKASIENFGTKTTMDCNTVNWEEGDQIALFTNVDNDEPILFTLAYGAGTPDGDFSTNENIDGKIFVAALYPYDENARYSSDKITTNLASSYTWAEGANGKAPMAALLPNIVLAPGNNSLDIIFKNAGSLIALTVNNIPAGYESISMTSGIAINGTTEISFTDGVPSSTVTATEEANKTTTINFAAAATTTDKVFYFPLGTTETATNITIAMSDGSNTQTLYNNKAMEKAVRNKRYYTSFSFDGMGNMPTQLQANDDINDKITTDDKTNFILDENANNVNITASTTKDLQIAVTSNEEIFELSGEGPEGSIDLSTPAETKILNINVPNATVELNPNEGFATYETVTAKTAANTLIIPASVTVKNLIVNGGNVRVYGKIVNIRRGDGNTDEKTIIYKEAGANIPNDLSEEFTVIDNSSVSSPFAGGNGTEASPYLIENADQLSKISDYYDTYNYFKIAEGVATLDLTGKGRFKLNGSFDGNGVTINNLATSLFEYVGNINKKQEIKISNLTAYVRTTDGRALVRNIFNPGETTFESVTLHGYIEGQYNMGSFYNYGTANAAGSEGASYTVNFINAKSDATLVCTTGNAIGGMLGHGFQGAGYTLSINMDADSDYTGVMYTTGTAKCYKVMAMCSTTTYILNGEEISRYTNEYTSTKLTVAAPTKREDGYYVTPATEVDHYIVYLNCQLTAYDENNNKLSNWAGLTWNLGNTTINSGFDSKIFELFESAEIVNGNEHEIGYKIENDVLKVYTGSSMNFKSGWITLQVNQYDSENNLLSTGITTVHTFADPVN